MVDEYRYNNHKWCKSIGVYDDKYMCWLVYDLVTSSFCFRRGLKDDMLEEFRVINVPEYIVEKFSEYMSSEFFEIDKWKELNGILIRLIVVDFLVCTTRT